MKKVLSVIIIWLSSFNVALAQNQVYIDSLKKSLEIAKEDTNKVNILNTLSKQLWQGDDYGQARKYADDALALALSLRIGKSQGWKKGEAKAYANIGIIYDFQGNLPEAQKNLLMSLKIREEIGDKPGIAESYNNIGIIYWEQNNYPEALENFQAALKIREEIGDKHGIAGSYVNIGNIYEDQGNYPEALKNHFASLKLFEEIGDKKGIAQFYNNVGNIYYDQGNYQESLKNHFAALKINEEIGDKSGMAGSNINIGSVYIKQKKNSEASLYIRKGLLLAKEIDYLDFVKNGYSALAALDSIQGNYKLALEHYKNYITYRDSLVNEQSTKKIVRTQMQLEFDKQESLAKAELQKQKILKYSFITGALLLLIAAGFFIFNMQRKRKLDAQIARLEKQNEIESVRNKISLDIHDDIGSGLTKINLLLGQFKLRTEKNPDQEQQELASKISAKSREVISGLGEIVWTANPEHDNLKSLLGFMRQYISRFLEDSGIHYTIDFPNETPDRKIHPELKRNLFLVLKESLNNVIKHSGATQVSIRFSQLGEKFTMEIADNGKGMDEKLFTTFGTGMKSMKKRIEEVKGGLKVNSSPGKGTDLRLEGMLY